MTSYNKAPCKDCASRCVGCHGMCMAYQLWAKKRTTDTERHRQMNSVSVSEMERCVKNGKKRIR